MSAEKPLHVRVAEALGWTYLGPSEVEDGWEGEPPDAFELLPDGIRRRLDQHVGVPRYDTDWSATGPLIERLKISIWPILKARPSEGYSAYWSADYHDIAMAEGVSISAATPLEAACRLILALAAADKLDA